MKWEEVEEGFTYCGAEGPWRTVERIRDCGAGRKSVDWKDEQGIWMCCSLESFADWATGRVSV